MDEFDRFVLEKVAQIFDELVPEAGKVPPLMGVTVAGKVASVRIAKLEDLAWHEAAFGVRFGERWVHNVDESGNWTITRLMQADTQLSLPTIREMYIDLWWGESRFMEPRS